MRRPVHRPERTPATRPGASSCRSQAGAEISVTFDSTPRLSRSLSLGRATTPRRSLGTKSLVSSSGPAMSGQRTSPRDLMTSRPDPDDLVLIDTGCAVLCRADRDPRTAGRDPGQGARVTRGAHPVSGDRSETCRTMEWFPFHPRPMAMDAPDQRNDPKTDRVSVITIQDARSARSATAERRCSRSLRAWGREDDRALRTPFGSGSAGGTLALPWREAQRRVRRRVASPASAAPGVHDAQDPLAPPRDPAGAR